MKRLPRRVIVTNIFGAAGYACMSLAWVLFVSVIFAVLLDASVIIIPPVLPQAAPDPLLPEEFSAVAIAVGYGVTIIAILATLAVVILLPYLIGKWGSVVLRRLLSYGKIPITTRHLFLLKLGLVLVPTAGMFVMSSLMPFVGGVFYAILLVGSVFTMLAIVFFVLQLFCARYLQVTTKNVW